MIFKDAQESILCGAMVAVLSLASLIGFILRRTTTDKEKLEVIRNLNARIRAWWLMVGVFFIAVLSGGLSSILMFCGISFFALREFVTLTPSRRSDHRMLFWVFFLILPMNYYLLAVHWYGLFSIFIPVYAFLWIPIRSALVGDSTEFLSRAAKTQWGLMVCVYFLGYAPALLNLSIAGYEHQNAKLLCFLVVIVQASDVLQYVFGKCFGKNKICPNISPNKTREGLIGGVSSATLIGALMWQLTPFTFWQAGAMAFIISLMGFFGGMTMSAIKRDRGVKDYGSLIPGHGGMLDRIDSLCFAAPVFFHLTRYLFAS